MTSQVTRASVMELARLPHHNLHVVERELPMADVLDMIRWPVQVVANCPRTFFQLSFQYSQGRSAAGDVCDWDRGLRCPGALTTRLLVS